MPGYWNRDIPRDVEPFRAYCTEHLPVPRPPAWKAITRRREDPPENLREYLRQTFGGAEHCADYRNGRAEQYGGHKAFRAHARRMSAPMTPDGYAWTPYAVGAPCEVCGAAL